MFKIIFFIFSYLLFVSAKNEVYDGYSLYRITVYNIEQTKIVNGLQNEIGIDIWLYAIPDRPGQILVAKDLKNKFENKLKLAGIEYQVEIENIKEKLDREDELFASTRKRNNGSQFPFDDIYTYEVVDKYMTELAQRYSNIVKIVTAGRSFEGRDMKYLKISTTDFQDTSKPIIMMESLIHAREWVTLPASLYAIQKLVIDVTELDLLQNIDWIIMPIANPDGFEYTHTDNRFWRKNRASNYLIGNSTCMGVDLNRNFDSAWSTASDSDVCSNQFHGSGPFSEPETDVIRDIILEHIDRLELFLDIHSYGSLVLYGYGYGTLPSNGLLLHLVGITIAENIDRVKLPSNRNYTVGNFNALLYPASGISQDWAQEVGVRFSYTVELPAWRNQAGVNGFLLDPEFIEQAGFETWEGIKAAARYIYSNYRKGN